MIKKILLSILVFLLIVIGSLFVIPIFFKEKLIKIAKTEINKSINAKVDFKDVNVSLFKSFPKLHFGLNDFKIIGVGKFKDIPLAEIKEFAAGIDLMKYLKDQKIEINSIYIYNPNINAFILGDSSANFDIIKPSAEQDKESKPFSLDLQKLVIEDGNISFADSTSKLIAKIRGLELKGSGNFGSDQFKAVTDLKTDSVFVASNGVAFLRNSAISVDATTDVDLTKKLYSFLETTIGINKMKLDLDGDIQQMESGTNLDLKFKTNDNDLKSFLSLLPSSIVKDMKDIETDGNFSLDGFIKGLLTETKIPGFDINLLVKNGRVKYKGLPKSIENLSIDLNAKNMSGIVDATTINLKNLKADLGGNPISAKGTVAGLTRMNINGNVNAKLDLADVQSFYPLKDQEMKGNLLLTGTAKGFYDKEKGVYPNVNALFDISNGYYKNKQYGAELKSIIANATLINNSGLIKDTRFELKNLSASLDGEPILAKATIFDLNNPNFDIALKGKANIEKWLKVFPIEGTEMKGKLAIDVTAKGKQSDIDNKTYQNIITNGNATLNSLYYNTKEIPAPITLSQAKIAFTPSSILIENANGNIGKSDFDITGNIQNYWSYILKNKDPLVGNIKFVSSKMDLNELKSPSNGAPKSKKDKTKEVEETLFVPADLNVNLNINLGQVLYDNIVLKNMGGAISINDETATFKDVTASLLGGTTVINGYYSTKNHGIPDIKLSYKINDFNLKQTFETFNTIQKIAPISKFITGTFSSGMELDGKLDKNMNPVLNSLTGGGEALVIRGQLDNSFKPFVELLKVVNIPQLQNMDLSNLKAKIGFKNGRVNLSPMDYQVKDTKMNIEGSHGFDNTMDYVIHMTVPKDKIGGEMKSIVDEQMKKLAAIGVKYDENAPIKFDVLMKGSIENPKISTNLKEVMKTFGNELKNQAIDKGKEVVKDKVQDGLGKVLPGLVKPNSNQNTTPNTGANPNATNPNTTPTNTDSVPKPAPPKSNPKEDVKNAVKGLFKPK
jgi:hypothetical protein